MNGWIMGILKILIRLLYTKHIKFAEVGKRSSSLFFFIN